MTAEPVREKAPWPEATLLAQFGQPFVTRVWIHMPDRNLCPYRKKKGLRTAPIVSFLLPRFKVTHPYHPLFGKEFDLVGYRNSWKKICVDYVDEAGLQISIPLDWTNAGGVDPFLDCSQGRSHFRTEELLRLSDLIDGIAASNRTKSAKKL